MCALPDYCFAMQTTAWRLAGQAISFIYGYRNIAAIDWLTEITLLCQILLKGQFLLQRSQHAISRVLTSLGVSKIKSG